MVIILYDFSKSTYYQIIKKKVNLSWFKPSYHLCWRSRVGEALYRFLLAQASAAYPEYKIHARGTHTEHKTRTVHAKDQNGNYTTRLEDYTETVTGL